MKKPLIHLTLALNLGLPAVALAQNTFPFPSDGPLGIGTTTPRAQIEVVNSSGDAAIILGNGSSDTVQLSYSSLGFGSLHAGQKGAAPLPLILQESGGNVGIGAVSPLLGTLDVRGTGELPALAVSKGGGGPSLLVAYVNNPYVEENIAFRVDRNRQVMVGNSDRNDGVLRVNGTIVCNGSVSSTTLELTSDRNVKQDFQPVSARELLAKVAVLPISTWAYTNSPSVRHLGPMAQDFQETFRLGVDTKHIGAGDGIGVALVAIQGLHELVQERESRISALEKRLAAQEQSFADRLARLEKAAATSVQQVNDHRRIPARQSDLEASAQERFSGKPSAIAPASLRRTGLINVQSN